MLGDDLGEEEIFVRATFLGSLDPFRLLSNESERAIAVSIGVLIRGSFTCQRTGMIRLARVKCRDDNNDDLKWIERKVSLSLLATWHQVLFLRLSATYTIE